MKKPSSNSPLDQALKFLSYRPRSESEIVSYLKRKKISPQSISVTINRLKDLQFIDDYKFCLWWQESRDRAHPVSARVLKQELYRKGIAKDTIAGIIDNNLATELARANQAIQHKRQFANLADPIIRQKATQFLARRGFSWEVIDQLIFKGYNATR